MRLLDASSAALYSLLQARLGLNCGRRSARMKVFASSGAALGARAPTNGNAPQPAVSRRVASTDPPVVAIARKIVASAPGCMSLAQVGAQLAPRRLCVHRCSLAFLRRMQAHRSCPHAHTPGHSPLGPAGRGGGGGHAGHARRRSCSEPVRCRRGVSARAAAQALPPLLPQPPLCTAVPEPLLSRWPSCRRHRRRAQAIPEPTSSSCRKHTAAGKSFGWRCDRS